MLKITPMGQDKYESNDAQCWQRFIEGDREALTYIYAQHYRPLLRYGCKLLSDEAVVEDCIQDLFFELWKNKARLGPTDSIRYYLLRSLRRKIVLAGRQRSGHSNVDAQSEEYPFAVEYSIEEKWIGEIQAAERQEKLNQALNQLSARQKEAIYLKFYNDMDYQQIGQIMDLNYQSIRTLVYRAIKVLRDYLALEVSLLLIFLH